MTRSQIFRDDEQSRRKTTGLHINLRPIEAFDLAHHGDPKDAPLCALMALSYHSCAACLPLQKKIEQESRPQAKTLKCFAGPCDCTVLVRVGNNLIAYLHTGQILLHTAAKTECVRATR